MPHLARALCALALFAAALAPAAAQRCIDFNGQAAAGGGNGGCNSVQVAMTSIVTGATNIAFTAGFNTTVFSGAGMPVITGSEITFAAGTLYNYVATAANNNTCNGTVRIAPCVPSCGGTKIFEVDAAVSDACTYSLAGQRSGTSDFWDLSTVGHAASSTVFGGKSAPLKLSTGLTTVSGVVRYATGNTAAAVCLARVVDKTAYSAPSPTGNTCFYKANARHTRACIPFKSIAEITGPRCANGTRQAISLTKCTPHTRGGVVCEATSSAICIRNGRYGASIAVTATLVLSDFSGLLSPKGDVRFTLYKTLSAVPPADQGTCIAVSA